MNIDTVVDTSKVVDIFGVHPADTNTDQVVDETKKDEKETPVAKGHRYNRKGDNKR